MLVRCIANSKLAAGPKGSPYHLSSGALRKLLHHAYMHSPYYRTLFNEREIKWSSISADDLSQIPILEKKDLRANFNLIKCANTISKNTRTRMTSGSTGSPILIEATKRECLFELYAWQKGYIKFGLRPQHLQLKFMAQASTSPYFEKTGMPSFFRRYRVSAMCSPAEKVNWLKKFRPHALFAHASVLGELATELEQKNETHHVPLIFSSSDMLWPGLRTRIAQRLRGQLVNVYGSIETGPIAWENSINQSLVIDPKLVLIEIVDDMGRHSKYGRVVCTVLWRRTLPLIRYAIGDIAETEDDGPVRNITMLHGRENELLYLPNGEVVSAGIMMWVLRGIPGIRQFQVVEQTDGRLQYQLVTDSDYPRGGDDLIRHRIEKRFAAMIKVSVQHVDYIRQVNGAKFSPFIKLRSSSAAIP